MESPVAVRRSGNFIVDGAQQVSVVMSAYRRGTGSELLDRKTQDRELKWHEIAPEDHGEFWAAIEKEWDSWLRYEFVPVLEPKASEEVLRTVD